MVELLLWPFIAGLVLTGLHAYFGLHVLARGVVFVDLSLAQVAALGMTVAVLAGHPAQSDAGYWYALAFALVGAVLFALARPFEAKLQQEALIGIVYAVSASLAVLALDRAPQGAEHIKQLLIGSILTVTPAEVGRLAVLYAAVGALHFAFRRQFLAASFNPSVARDRVTTVLWDVLFYASFALVVTSSVRIAGVLLVFTYLIVPAALAGLVARDLRDRVLLAWAIGAALTAAGLAASWIWDLPTGPALVVTFGAALGVVALASLARLTTRRNLASIGSIFALLSGTLLVLFPRMDHPWLDAIERIVPPVQTAFLDDGERKTRVESLQSIARAGAELERLRALDQDVRWGKIEMEEEKVERLRQYLAGRGELSAGDRLVLRHLKGLARDRQQFGLGLPLLGLGGYGLWRLRRRAPPTPSA